MHCSLAFGMQLSIIIIHTSDMSFGDGFMIRGDLPKQKKRMLDGAAYRQKMLEGKQAEFEKAEALIADRQEESAARGENSFKIPTSWFKQPSDDRSVFTPRFVLTYEELKEFLASKSFKVEMKGVPALLGICFALWISISHRQRRSRASSR